jgi:hypothetical protein
MGQFDDLIALKGSGSPLDRLTPSRVVPIEGLPSGVRPPEEYTEFIERVGFGVVGADVMALYNGLVRPEEVFAFTLPDFSNVLLFADDMAGNAFGFDLADWSVVEVSAQGKVSPAIPASFSEFVRSKVFLSRP